jgi:hypothetical protein
MPKDRSPIQYQDSLLRLRFVSDLFERRSVPIYELGVSLIAVQRIINKAYLFQNGELSRSSRLEGRERQRVSLQIGAREKASDGYGLIAFVSDPLIVPILQQVIATAITGLGAYVYHKIHQRRKASLGDQEILIVSIYDEVRQLTDRIGSEGKAEKLELLPGKKIDADPIIISPDTKRYVRDLSGEPVLGAIRTITGPVVRLYPRRLMVETIFEGRRIKVWLKDRDFRTLRYDAKVDSRVRFTGHPMYKLGARSVAYKEFSADKIEWVPVTKDGIFESYEE